MKGRVTDATTQAGISGAEVYLQTYELNCWTCSGGYTIQSATTDANGNFQFTFTPEHAKGYQLTSQVNKYFNDFGQPVRFDPRDHPKEMNVPLQPQGWLKVHLKNVSPYNASDNIIINNYSGIYYVGMQIDTIVNYGFVFGNANTSISWTVIKNSMSINHSAQVYCPAFDTTLYNINY